MPHYMERADFAAITLSALNKELEHPLSLLLVNVKDVDFLANWEPWLRRVAAFVSEEQDSYNLISTAVGLDLYNRLNLRLKASAWSEVPTQQVGWPFDVVSVTIEEIQSQAGLGKAEGWKRLLGAQLQAAQRFLLMVQGPELLVRSLPPLLERIALPSGAHLKMRPQGLVTFVSADVPAALAIWRAYDPSARGIAKISDDELDSVSDLMQWGEDGVS